MFRRTVGLYRWFDTSLPLPPRSHNLSHKTHRVEVSQAWSCWGRGEPDGLELLVEHHHGGSLSYQSPTYQNIGGGTVALASANKVAQPSGPAPPIRSRHYPGHHNHWRYNDLISLAPAAPDGPGIRPVAFSHRQGVHGPQHTATLPPPLHYALPPHPLPGSPSPAGSAPASRKIRIFTDNWRI